MNPIPIEQPTQIIIYGDTELVVRRLKFREAAACGKLAGLRDDLGSQMAYCVLLARCALANKHNEGKSLVDCDTQQPVKLRFTHHDELGTVLSLESIDALDQATIQKVANAAEPVRLAPEQRGNSSGSPAGSTDSVSGPAAN